MGRVISRGPKNILKWSTDFSDTIWTKQDMSVTAGFVTDPRGGNTAQELVFTAAGNKRIIQLIPAEINPQNYYNISCWMRSDDGPFNMNFNYIWGGAISVNLPVIVTTDWQRLSAEDFNPNNGSSCFFGISNPDALERTIQAWHMNVIEGFNIGVDVPTSEVART